MYNPRVIKAQRSPVPRSSLKEQHNGTHYYHWKLKITWLFQFQWISRWLNEQVIIINQSTFMTPTSLNKHETLGICVARVGQLLPNNHEGRQPPISDTPIFLIFWFPFIVTIQWRQFTNFLGGQNFLWRRGKLFLRHHAKSPVSAPPIEVNSCTKMY